MYSLRKCYNDLLNGDYTSSFEESNVKLINKRAIEIIKESSMCQQDLEDMDLIIRISNILYNNTSFDNLPLEDGIYDILFEKCKQYIPNFQVGAEVIKFTGSAPRSQANGKQVIPALINYPKDIDYRVFQKVFTDTFEDRSQKAFANIHNTVSDRQRTISHKYPKLVGTLDKCKFVLDSQAKEAQVFHSPNVKIFERDFLAKHAMMGLIDMVNPFNMVAEFKYDGLSVEAEVNNKIISARTRGDLEADLATDLTDILYGYRFPNNISDSEVIGMKFEAIITKYDMIRLANETGKVYRNMRTAIAGIIGASNARDYLDYITLVPLATSLDFDNRYQEIEFLNRYFAAKEPLRYIPIYGAFSKVLFEVKQFVEDADWYRDYMPFAYDGVVVSYVDPTLVKTLGRENHINKYSIAIKFSPKVRQTRFRGYEYTVGANGTITPMILFDPVEFNGTIHYKASGHSYERFKGLALAYNDIIDVSYVNEVMPYVSKVECPENSSNTNPVERFIDYCPVCGHVLEESISGKTVICPNKECEGRSIARVSSMIKKINFKDFAEESIASLGITSFSQLIRMQLKDVESLGEANSIKFIERVNELKTKQYPDYVLIGALGFSNIAVKSWQLILKEVKIEEVLRLDPQELMNKLIKIKGIGKVAVNTILDERSIYYKDLLTIAAMPNVIRTFGSTKEVKSIVMTGFRDAQLQQDIIDRGASNSENLTKSTYILVIPYEGFSSSKVDKAIKYGTRIISVDEFRKNIDSIL